jgi:Protein of unknown function (DUF1382)
MPISKCNVVTMREMLDLVKSMRDARMEFVPIPVVGDQDREKLRLMLSTRLEEMIAEAEKEPE